MAHLSELRQGVDRAWETVQAGWRSLVDKASQAITRFRPGQADDDDTRNLLLNSPSWALLDAELRETREEVLVRLEIPGMEPHQFDIDIHDDVLRVSGERLTERHTERGNYHLAERAYGRFERTLRLPTQVDAAKTEAKYEHGVLKVRLPKHHNVVSRRIPVKNR